MTWKAILTGVGGQGIISAGILLAETAVVHEGRHAVQSQSYGAEMRGGLSRTDVTISDDPVIYPKVDQAHVLVCLHRKGLHAHLSALRPGGILITDCDEAPVTMRVDCRHYPVAITAETRALLGTTRSTNICSLGLLVGVTGIVSVEAMKTAITERYRKHAEDVLRENLQALDLGLNLAAAARPVSAQSMNMASAPE
jgi:2-oxoglutarate ferredoxin oxidoreductase subunit gamma